VRDHGSIEAFFAEGDNPAAPNVYDALESFSSRALETDLRQVYGAKLPVRAGVGYFFPRPSRGSACKRLNLFLRWMVRRDAIDLGVWRTPAPSRLVVPLDTHVVRVGRCLRLTRGRCGLGGGRLSSGGKGQREGEADRSQGGPCRDRPAQIADHRRRVCLNAERS